MKLDEPHRDERYFSSLSLVRGSQMEVKQTIEDVAIGVSYLTAVSQHYVVVVPVWSSSFSRQPNQDVICGTWRQLLVTHSVTNSME